LYVTAAGGRQGASIISTAGQGIVAGRNNGSCRAINLEPMCGILPQRRKVKTVPMQPKLVLALCSGLVLSSAFPAPSAAIELFGPAGVGIPVAEEPLFLAVGDFNEDGASDLAVTSTPQTTSPTAYRVLSILLGDGLGGFSRVADVDVGARPISIAVADLDGDGT
jgi:hypothetical protein